MNTEILMKALFLESKYNNLLKEIVAQKNLFKTPLDYWTTYFKVAQYQTVCQGIIISQTIKRQP